MFLQLFYRLNMSGTKLLGAVVNRWWRLVFGRAGLGFERVGGDVFVFTLTALVDTDMFTRSGSTGHLPKCGAAFRNGKF